MRKKAFLVMVFLLFVGSLAACESVEGDSSSNETSSSAWDHIKEKGKLVVGTAGTLYPTSYHKEKSNQLTGYDVEVIREAAKRLGLDVKFLEMGFDGMLPSIKSGKIDMAANDITITDERKKVFQFSTPIKYSFGTMMVRADHYSGIHSVEDIKGKKAAGAATSLYTQFAKKHDAEIVTYDNATNDQYLQDVANKRTDVILNDYYLQKLALKALPQFDLVIQPDIKYMPSEEGLVVKKGNKELLKNFNQKLKEMKQDGTMAKISKKFYDADVTEKKEYNFQK